MSDLLHRTLDILFQSRRRLPAHFSTCEDSGRTGTFLIGFDGLSDEDDERMSHEAYYSLLRQIRYDTAPDPKFYYAVLRLGENMMMGRFILTSILARHCDTELYQALRRESEDRLTDSGITDYSWLDCKLVTAYLFECAAYGRALAEKAIQPIVD